MNNLNLGCGNVKQKDWVGIDIRNFPEVDYVMNVGKEPLPFMNNSVDKIHADHLFEHFYPEELFFCVEHAVRTIAVNESGGNGFQRRLQDVTLVTGPAGSRDVDGAAFPKELQNLPAYSQRSFLIVSFLRPHDDYIIAP